MHLNELRESSKRIGSALPTVDQVKLNVTFSRDFPGADTKMPTRVVVVSDLCTAAQKVSLICTNNFHDMYFLYSQKSTTKSYPVAYGYTVQH